MIMWSAFIQIEKKEHKTNEQFISLFLHQVNIYNPNHHGGNEHRNCQTKLGLVQNEEKVKMKHYTMFTLGTDVHTHRTVSLHRLTV